MHSGGWGKFLPFGVPRTSMDIILTIGYYLFAIIIVYYLGVGLSRIGGGRHGKR